MFCEMKDIVLILDPATINLAAEVCAELEGCEVYVIDPMLVDKLPVSQFGNVELMTGFAGPEYLSMDRTALAAAAEMEAHFDRARIEAGCEVSVLGWRFLNYYYFLMAAQWYSALRTWLAARLTGRKMHLFTGDHPAEYYFDSFFPATLLSSHLSAHGVTCISHNYTNSRTVEYPVLDLRGCATADYADCDLVHLPTCIYDGPYFSSELRASGRRFINVRSQYWDVDIQADRHLGLADPIAVLETFDRRMRTAVEAFTEAMRAAAQHFLAPFFAIPNFRDRQAEHLALKYRSQLISYMGLQRCFRDMSLGRLVISNHDTGLHGPLIAFAEERGSQVVMLPHSKVSMDVEFRCTNLVLLTHPIQGQPAYNPDRRIIEHHAIRYPENFYGTSARNTPLRVISLVLNDTATRGILVAPTDAYFAGIGQIVEWAKRNDIVLKVRVRPGGSVIRLLSKLFDMDATALTRQLGESMEEHVQTCDLCLMYETPTSACLHFLRNSIPILNPILSEHVGAPRSLLHPDLIQAESIPVTLSRLDGFIAEPLAMQEYGFNQFSSYLRLFREAKTLRTLLA